jgi:hypothetical protein
MRRLAIVALAAALMVPLCGCVVHEGRPGGHAASWVPGHWEGQYWRPGHWA